MRKSANVEKRRCHVARAAIVTNFNGARDRYGSASTAAVHREQNSRRSAQHPHGAISERRQISTQEEAAVRFALRLLQGKWKIGILCRLQEGPTRLGDLRRLFPQASKKMLTQHLRQMERDGLIVRTDLSGKIHHVEYSLSNPRGLAVSRLLHILAEWRTECLEIGNDRHAPVHSELRAQNSTSGGRHNKNGNTKFLGVRTDAGIKLQLAARGQQGRELWPQ
ncbi:MAG: winged helix-turn-helix transcriptional regulator [Acidobacteriaceae bacterium]